MLGGAALDDLVTDDEIDAYLPGGILATASTTAAAIAIGEYVVNQYAHLTDISGGGGSASLSQLVKQMRVVVNDLRMTVAGPSIASAMRTAVTTDAYGVTRDPAFTRQMGDPSGMWPRTEDETA